MRPNKARILGWLAYMAAGAIIAGTVLATAKADDMTPWAYEYGPAVCDWLRGADDLDVMRQHQYLTDQGMTPLQASEAMVWSVELVCPEVWPVLERFTAHYPAGVTA